MGAERPLVDGYREAGGQAATIIERIAWWRLDALETALRVS